MGSSHPNEVSRIAQHDRKGEGRKKGKGGKYFHRDSIVTQCRSPSQGTEVTSTSTRPV